MIACFFGNNDVNPSVVFRVSPLRHDLERMTKLNERAGNEYRKTQPNDQKTTGCAKIEVWLMSKTLPNLQRRHVMASAGKNSNSVPLCIFVSVVDFCSKWAIFSI